MLVPKMAQSNPRLERMPGIAADHQMRVSKAVRNRHLVLTKI
jgi:hypothetical protein